MRLQRYAAMHILTVIGEVDIQKDRFGRYYVNDTRIALVRSEGLFTALICPDGQAYYVMTSDWQVVQRLGTTTARSR
jgi:hypothetical protein